MGLLAAFIAADFDFDLDRRRCNPLSRSNLERRGTSRLHESAHHCDFDSVAEARTAVIEYIENFYNSRRRHSALGHRAPIEYEAETRRPAAA